MAPQKIFITGIFYVPVKFVKLVYEFFIYRGPCHGLPA